MDKFRKALLGAAGILAVTASGQKPADAAIGPEDNSGLKQDAIAKLAGYPAYADPLFELTKRTNGSFKHDAVETALREMFVNASPATVEAAPTLLAGLTGLGAPTDLVAKSRDVLVEIISKAANIDDEMKAALETRLNEAAPSNVKLAAVHKRRRRPDEIGQTGGGGGGAPGAAS